ncbi:MAG: exosome protein [Candidatus Methanomethylicota archaeon]|nr:MAG: exosome protein [Candidatus Verstraetearchaeota archaeon]
MMSGKVSVNHVREIIVGAFCHATEDVRKVEKAILNLFPEEFRGELKLSRESLKGYYGNPITVLKLKSGDQKLIASFLEYLSSSLSDSDKFFLESTFDLRVKGSSIFYLRLSKTDAYNGSIVVSDSGDVIKVELKFKVKSRRELMELCKSINLLMGER